jgi:hypothetical protein
VRQTGRRPLRSYWRSKPKPIRVEQRICFGERLVKQWDRKVYNNDDGVDDHEDDDGIDYHDRVDHGVDHESGHNHQLNRRGRIRYFHHRCN